jgi:hypothetical protein
MNPQTIKTLLSCAESAENQNSVFDPFVAFSLRWIAWESLRIKECQKWNVFLPCKS